MSNKNAIEIYFSELMREFFDYWTPSYYRVNLSNPRTLLHELLSYCELSKWTSYLQHEQIKCIIDEYLYLSKKDITYGYYCDILKNFHNYLKEISNKKKIELQELNNDANNIITRLVSILKELDKNYYQGCVTQLKDILSKKDHKPEDFTKIKKICFALSAEILRRWYSKGYVYEKIMEIYHDEIDIDDFIKHFNKKDYKYTVYIKFCKLPKEINERAEIISIFKWVLGDENVSLDCFDEINILTNNDIRMNKDKSEILLWNFKKPKSSLFIKIKKEAIDYDQAVKKSKDIIDKLLNEIYFEYSSSQISYFHHAICIKDSEQEIKMPIINPQIDNIQERGSLKFFNSFNESLKRIETKNGNESDTYLKLNTLLKFYRYFMKADTLEHKFLNLWIWWEHVFSLNTSKDQHTWKNIYNYFPYIHSIHYIENILKNLLNVQLKRNCQTDAQKIQLETSLNTLITTNPKYKLSNLLAIIKLRKETWDSLLNIEVIKNDDLTKIKIFRLHEKFKNPKKFLCSIHDKAKWNLFRIYRVRNFIVHRWWSQDLGIPLDIIVWQLESFYRDLILVLTSRFTASERFDNIEQLFSAYERTYQEMIGSEQSLSNLSDPKDFKRQLLNKHLIY